MSGFRTTGPIPASMRYPTQLLNTRDLSRMQDWDAFAVTPADGSDLPNGQTDAIAVTVGGNVNVQLTGGGTAVLTGLTAGQIVRIAVNRILSTSTTATGIFALYTQG